MTDERSRNLAVPGRPKPDVTYSRVPEPPRRVARPRKAAEPSGPMLAAVEVPLIDPPHRDEIPRVAPEIRAPVIDGPELSAEPDPFLDGKERRPRRRLRPLTILTFLAVAIGVGILAATFGTVSKPAAPEASTAALAPAATVPAATAAAPAPLAKADTAPEGGAGTPAIRTISLSGSSAPDAPPPKPVPRPERFATAPDATTAPAGDDGDASPAGSAKTAPAAELRKSVPAASAPSKAPPVKAAAKPANDNDEYIARIERTLSENDPGPGAPPANLKPPTGAMAAPVAAADPAAMSGPATTSAAMAAPDPAPGGILDLSMPPPPGIPIPPVDIPNVGPIKIQ